MVGFQPMERISNSRFMRNLYPSFYKWVADENMLLSDLRFIAGNLENYLCNHVLTDNGRCKGVVNQLSKVLGNCDNLNFDSPEEVFAYLIMHFLERYHRFQLIYLALLQEGVLPIRNLPSDILDVGTGPAVALYSLSDMLNLLICYGIENDIDVLKNLEFNFDYIEKSIGFRNFLHEFTEFINYNQRKYSIPYHHGSFWDFKGLNFQRKKHELQLRLIEEEMEYYDSYDEPISRGYAQLVIDNEKGGWKDAYRYR
jgi:hypothetical protein